MSENQAGTTTVLLVGAVFLLIAIQGTPLRKASKDSVELADREAAEITAEKALAEIEGGEPEKARETIGSASAARPEIENLSGLPQISGFAYEREVIQAIERIVREDSLIHKTASPQIMAPYFHNDQQIDALVHYGGDPAKSIAVEVSFSKRDFYNADKLRRDILTLVDAADAVLIVSNRPPTAPALNYLNGYAAQAGRKIVHVTWAGKEDNATLSRALKDLCT